MNEIYKKWVNDKKIQLIVLFILVFVGNFVISIFMKYPIINDEFCILSDAVQLSGKYDWSLAYNSSTNGYWGYGFSIFLLPFFYLTNSINVIYHIGLGINSALIGGIAIICYLISDTYIQQKEKWISFLCSISVALFPGLTFYSKMFLNEIALAFVAWICLYLILTLLYCEMSNKKKFVLEVLLGGVAFYAYSVHGRGLVLVGVCILILLVIKFITRKVNLIPILGGMMLVFLLDSFIKNNLYGSLILTNPGETYNSATKVIGGYFQFLKLENVKGLISSIVTQSYYLTATTAGIFCIFIGITISLMINYKKGSIRIKNSYCVILSYSFCVVIGTLIVSALHFAFVFIQHETMRREYIIYGRYVDTVITLAIFCTLQFFFLDHDKKIKKTVLLSGLIIACGITGMGATKIANWLVEYGNADLSYVMSEGIIPIGGQEFFESSSRYSCIRLAIIVFILFLLFSYLLAKKKIIIFAVIILCSLYSTGYSIKHYLMDASKNSYESTESAAQFLNNINLEDTTIYLEEYWGRTLNLQSKFPEIEICMLDSKTYGYIEYERIKRNAILLSNTDKHYDYYLEDCKEIETDGSIYAWAYGAELQRNLKNKGFTLLEKSNVTNIPIESFITSSGDSVFNEKIYLVPNESTYGPYYFVPAGEYHVELQGQNLNETEVACIDNNGTTTYELFNQKVSSNDLEFDLKLKVNATQLEILVKNISESQNVEITAANISSETLVYDGKLEKLFNSNREIKWRNLNGITHNVELGENTYQGQAAGKIFKEGKIKLKNLPYIAGKYKITLTGINMDGIEAKISDQDLEIEVVEQNQELFSFVFETAKFSEDISIEFLNNSKYEEVINTNISIIYVSEEKSD